MPPLLSRLRLPRLQALARYRRAEDGAVTIPALLWLPLFIMIMVASVELCVLTIKQTLLERGVDLSTRILRLGISEMPTHTQLKRSICSNIAFLSTCMDDLAIEIFEVNQETWTSSGAGRAVLCSDAITEDTAPTLQRGLGNQLMVLRACLRVTPMEKLNPLSQMLIKNENGQYALVVTTAFVNEPQ